MKKTIIGIFLSAGLWAGLGSCNPRRVDSKFLINEVLMTNETSYVNTYGEHSPWIEIFNKSYNIADLAGCYLKMSNTLGDTATYIIPKGDINTKVAQRQQTIFFADGEANKGTFHTNFSLDPTKKTWIALFDTRSKLLDEITIPENTLKADQSYARHDDGSSQWEVKGGGDPSKYVTPKANNMTKESNPKMDKFTEKDKSGIGMAITAMSVVFTALLLLYLSFRTVGKYHSVKDDKKTVDAVSLVEKKEEKSAVKATSASNDVYAAIAMALYEFRGGMHDLESNVITICNTQSPWNSKVSMMRSKPIRK